MFGGSESQFSGGRDEEWHLVYEHDVDLQSDGFVLSQYLGRHVVDFWFYLHPGSLYCLALKCVDIGPVDIFGCDDVGPCDWAVWDQVVVCNLCIGLSSWEHDDVLDPSCKGRIL